MNAHRLNHHDILAVKAFEDRVKREARNKCLALIGWVLVGWALVALLAIGLTAQGAA